MKTAWCKCCPCLCVCVFVVRWMRKISGHDLSPLSARTSTANHRLPFLRGIRLSMTRVLVNYPPGVKMFVRKRLCMKTYKRMGFGATLIKAFTRVSGWGLFAMVHVECSFEKWCQRIKGCVVMLLLGNSGHGIKLSLFLGCFLFSH